MSLFTVGKYELSTFGCVLPPKHDPINAVMSDDFMNRGQYLIVVSKRGKRPRDRL